jgi:hypothetical protein
MMLTSNNDVPNGQANGSRVRLQRVSVRPGERETVIELSSGTRIRTYLANQILSLTLCHEVEDIIPREFEITPAKCSFRAHARIMEDDKTVLMKGVQFEVISNSVTTGHKLQGSSLDRLVVMELYYGKNWIYVILSRVRTMKGLFLTEPLSTDLAKYAMSENMKSMIARFQQQCGLHLFSDDDYIEYLD